MIGIPIGLLYSNVAEWAIHRYVLHGLGKRKGSMWSFHWREHHSASRKNDMFDEAYTRPTFSGGPQTREAVALLALAAAHLPALPVAPFFVGTVLYRTWRYHRVHRRAHLDSHWAKTNLPWHYDHHMGKDQDTNWCVTNPFFDTVMGTRVSWFPFTRT